MRKPETIKSEIRRIENSIISTQPLINAIDEINKAIRSVKENNEGDLIDHIVEKLTVEKQKIENAINETENANSVKQRQINRLENEYDTAVKAQKEAEKEE